MSNNEEDIPQVEDKVIRISKRASRRLAKRVDELDELLDDTTKDQNENPYLDDADVDAD
jgi:hypothetical protein